MRQFSKSRRRLAAGAFLIVAGPVALGSVAYACQSLQTLHANPSNTAAAGSTITLYGKNYSDSATSTPIRIRLDTRDGRLLGEFSARKILDNVSVTIPADVAVGAHTLLAVQHTSTGSLTSGGPGRADVTITAAGRSASSGSAASPAAPASEPVAATPAAVTPAAAAAASAPAAAKVATGTPAARTAAPAPAPAAAAPTAAAAGDTAAAAVATPAAPAGPTAPTAAAAIEAAQVSVGGLVPASSDSNSILPGLTLGAGLALVLLSLGAFIKSSRTVRSDVPLAG